MLTTHYMDEAEQLCDRLIVVDKGKIMAEGTPAALIREYSTREVARAALRLGAQRHVAAELEGIGERLEVLPDRVLIYAARRRGGPRTGRARRGLRPDLAGAPLVRSRTCSCG